MLRSMIAPLSVGFLAFAMVLIVLQLFQMEAFRDIRVDHWFDQIEEVPESELQRRERIRNLPISDEKQTILINRQVFLGAGRHMVVYALGEPRRKIDARNEEGDNFEAWVYHFTDDYQPTVLEFAEHSLSEAYKASLTEVQKLASSVTH